MAKRRTRRRNRYRMTPRRRAALKKAQLASAKKRSGLAKVGNHISNNRVRYAAGLASAAVIGGVVARHKLSGSEFSIQLSRMNRSNQRNQTSTRPVVGVRSHREAEPWGGRFEGSKSASAPRATNRVIIGSAGVRNIFGVGFTYRHRELTRRNMDIVRGRKVKTLPVGRPPRKVDRDAIPFYDPQGYKVGGVRVTNIVAGEYTEAKGGSRFFPSASVERARKQNQALRKKGMIR